MKKYLILTLLLLSIFGFANPLFSYPNFITVDSLNNNDPSNDNPPGHPGQIIADWTDGFSIFFPAGQYEFSVYDGAWNAWGYVDMPNEGWLWSMEIYQQDTNTNYWLGNLIPYATSTEALAAHLGESIIINQSSGGNLWFYISDVWVSDNEGTVTASVSAVPEPATMVLLGLGLIGLFGLKRKIRK